MVAGLLVAGIAGLVSRATNLKEDASLAALYLVALALGVALVSRQGSQLDLLHILFGSALGVDGPGLLLVAMGIPRQEKWIHAHLEDLGVPVCIGIGGSLDVISGRKQRAPVWMQRCGLEWLYRTVKEPRRLPRLAALPRIVWRTFGELLRR